MTIRLPHDLHAAMPPVPQPNSLCGISSPESHHHHACTYHLSPHRPRIISPCLSGYVIQCRPRLIVSASLMVCYLRAVPPSPHASTHRAASPSPLSSRVSPSVSPCVSAVVLCVKNALALLLLLVTRNIVVLLGCTWYDK